MRDARSLLTQYARYHRDPRNIATHLLGIPLIVLAIGVLLAKPMIPVAGANSWFTLNPAWALWAAASLWYLTRGHLLMAVLTSVCNAVLIAAAQWIALQTGAAWLQWGVGLFVLGWVIQFIGHYYEGRKPAFMDDVVGLLVGPMFVCAEIAFALGLAPALRQSIETEAGPTRLRDLHASAVR